MLFVDMEIMKASLFSSSTKFLVLCVATTIPSIAMAADVLLQKAPPLTVEQAPAYPENLARYQLGVEVQATPQSNGTSKLQLSSVQQDRTTAQPALLCDDPS